jgi:hypothetical protein
VIFGNCINVLSIYGFTKLKQRGGKRMAKIHCSINNCHYWNQGNICHASEILVSGDSWAAQTPDHIDAPDASNVPPMNASTCMDTCCKTFVDKNSDQINVDQITRNP